MKTEEGNTTKYRKITSSADENLGKKCVSSKCSSYPQSPTQSSAINHKSSDERANSLFNRLSNSKIIKALEKHSNGALTPKKYEIANPTRMETRNLNPREWFPRPINNRKYIVYAAISGAIALGIDYFVHRCWRIHKHEYGIESKICNLEDPTPEIKETFQRANRSHLMNSAIMMAIPYVARRPSLTFTLLSSGIIGFSGLNYYMTFKGRKRNLIEASWFGGVLLICGWLSFII